MIKVKTSVKDKDIGFKSLVSILGDTMGRITLGVQGKEALEKHPNSELVVGEIAAVHELGLGVPRRSWLRDWMDTNQQRLLDETRTALQAVIAGKISRKQALIGLGYRWVEELRTRIWTGKITPGLSPYTRPAASPRYPLWDSGTLANSITYALFLPHLKSITDKVQRSAARRGVKR